VQKCKTKVSSIIAIIPMFNNQKNSTLSAFNSYYNWVAILNTGKPCWTESSSRSRIQVQ